MSQAIDPRVDIGHVHLKVADLDRALGSWRDVLGFEEQGRMGDQAAFVSAGGYHHHIGLNTWESQGNEVHWLLLRVARREGGLSLGPPSWRSSYSSG